MCGDSKMHLVTATMLESLKLLEMMSAVQTSIRRHFLIMRVINLVTRKGVTLGVGILIHPIKYVGEVRVCFDPKMSHSFIQNCCWITVQVSHHQG